MPPKSGEEGNECAPKKAKIGVSVGKLMATVFWDAKGVLLMRYMPKGTMINAATYCTILKDLREALYRKRLGLRGEEVFLIHDNARPHTAGNTLNVLRSFKWTVFAHPPYSPDLAPSDYWLFPLLKEELAGEKFTTDTEVQRADSAFFRSQPTEFYATTIEKLVSRYNKCLDLGGDYIEK